MECVESLQQGDASRCSELLNPQPRTPSSRDAQCAPGTSLGDPSTHITQEISIDALQVNMISFNVIPPDLSVDSIFSNIIEEISV